MKTKEEIIKILKDEFGDIYCHNCESQVSGNNCDDCHRKMMGWSISEGCASVVADKILED